MPDPSPSTNRSRLLPALKQVAPFALTALAAWVTAPIGSPMVWRQYALSVVLLFASWTFGLTMGLRGHMRSGTVIGSLGFFAAVGLLRNSAGGSISGVSSVALLAVFQTALYVRDRRALWIVLAGLLAFYVVPLITIGPPEYPHSGYRSALLAVAVGSIVGLVTHGLVANIRRRAYEARRRERTLARVNETLQQLFSSPQPRDDACTAVKEISEATTVGIYESEAGSRSLRLSSSTSGPAITPHRTAQRGSAVYEALRSGEPILITDDPAARVGNVEHWRAAGSPDSILYQPLLKEGVAIGVMFVAWQGRVSPEEPRVIVASLLAHEIASVIDRADVIMQLTDEALTDALTGLPNRRAWNLRLEREVATDGSLAVAMFDIDHFKRFNDAHGHPAGDTLLREAAAAWRAEIRTTDFLARLGGEEFGLLLTSGDIPTMHAMVERLRALMPLRQSCSAGIALREDGDTPETLVSRADAALYEAKAEGRDRSVFTGDYQARASGA